MLRVIGCFLCVAAAMAQTSTVVADNADVRVLKVTVPRDHKTGTHEHKVNRVMVYLSEGSQVTRPTAGEAQQIRWKAGDVLWSPAAGPHIAEVTADGPVTIVEIELKRTPSKATPIPPPLDPVRVDPKHYQVEFENHQVRVIRARIGAGESTPLHEHSLPRVVTFLTAQDMRVTTEDGRSERSTHAAGDVMLAGKAKHVEQNLAQTVFEVVAVELK